MNHTPGPWKADIRSGIFAIIPADQYHTCLSDCATFAIAYARGQDEESSPGAYRYLSPEQASNARLIAAAPDMLAALMEIQANPNDPRAHRMALDAISKAKGERA